MSAYSWTFLLTLNHDARNHKLKKKLWSYFCCLASRIFQAVSQRKFDVHMHSFFFHIFAALPTFPNLLDFADLVVNSFKVFVNSVLVRTTVFQLFSLFYIFLIQKLSTFTATHIRVAVLQAQSNEQFNPQVTNVIYIYIYIYIYIWSTYS